MIHSRNLKDGVAGNKEREVRTSSNTGGHSTHVRLHEPQRDRCKHPSILSPSASSTSRIFSPLHISTLSIDKNTLTSRTSNRRPFANSDDDTMADEQPRGIDHTDSIDSNDGPKQPDKKKSRRPASECASGRDARDAGENSY